MNYPIHEIFHTFQGEGVHMGKAAFFVRLYGCPVHCPWCDSAGTWHPKWVPNFVRRLSAEAIAGEARVSNAGISVITGGEPTIHDLAALASALRAEGMMRHLETSGGFPITGDWDWITLSPKRWKPPLPINVILAHEFKLIIEKPEDIEFYLSMIDGDRKRRPLELQAPVWLHPEWSHRADKVVLNAITEAVKRSGGQGRLRAGWQLHKFYSADSLDPGSRPLVPLGGDPSKGY